MTSILSYIKSSVDAVKDYIFPTEDDEPKKEPIKEFKNKLSDEVKNLKDGEKISVEFAGGKFRPADYVLSYKPGVSQKNGSDPESDKLIEDEMVKFSKGETDEPTIHVVKLRPNRENRGQHFNGLITEAACKSLENCSIHLAPYQIYTKSQYVSIAYKTNDIQTHCLWHCIKTHSDRMAAKLDRKVKSARTQRRDAIAVATTDLFEVIKGPAKLRMLKQINEVTGIPVHVTYLNNNGNREYKTYGEQIIEEKQKGPGRPKKNLPHKLLELGVYRGHYFINDELIPKINNRAITVYKLIETILGCPIDPEFDIPQIMGQKKIQLLTLLIILDKIGCINEFNNDDDMTSNGLIPPKEGCEVKVTKHSDEAAKCFYENLYVPDPNDPSLSINICDKFFLNNQHNDSAKKQLLTGNSKVYYADFETCVDKNNKHVPYMVAAVSREENGGFGEIELCEHSLSNLICYGQGNYIDEHLGKKILNKMAKPLFDNKEAVLLIYFHNLRYDSNFIITALDRIKTIETTSRTFETSGHFKPTGWHNSIKVHMRDTWAFINTPLADFNKSFDIKDPVTNAPMGKMADFPYNEYTLKKLQEIDATIKFNGKDVDIYDLARDYCLQDCRVLQQGFDQFRKQAQRLDLDVDNFLTVAGMASGYMKKEGCLYGVIPLKGAIRRYVQQTVVGGRVCVRGNEPLYTEEETVDFDATSLYPSAMAIVDGYPTGHPKKFTGKPPASCLRPNTRTKIPLAYVATVRVKSIGKELHFSTLSKKVDDKRVWGKGAIKPGDIMILNNQQIKDAQEHQQFEFEYIGGLYWPSYNTKINEVIKKLFKWRKELKEAGNPLQLVVKLIMNSSYGKLVEREHQECIKWYKCDQNEALCRAFEAGVSYDYLECATPNKQHNKQCHNLPLWKLKYNKVDFKHTNYAHCGSLVLAFSKKIMYEVTTELDDDICYTDTDSMILPVSALEKFMLTERGKKLVGNDLGQFHTDFAWSTKTKGTITASRCLFLDKKAYICQLQNSEKPDEVEYHFRFKGIPTKTINAHAKKEGMNVFKLYEKIKTDGYKFDLLLDAVRFKQGPTTVETVEEFTRSVGPYPKVKPVKYQAC